MAGTRRRRLLVVLTVAVALVAVACGGGGDEPSATEVEAGVYAGVVRWALGRPDPAAVTTTTTTVAPVAGDPPLPLVYVAGAADRAIAVAVQAAVVKELKDDAVVRFADGFDDAVDDGDPGAPVKEEALLVLLGPFQPKLVPLVVDVQLYRHEKAAQRFIVEVSEVRDRWWMVTAATPQN